MVVLAQAEGLMLLAFLAVLTILIGSICGIVAVAKIGALREVVSRLEATIRLLKDRIAAAEAALRRLTGGGVSGPEPADKREGAAPSAHEGDVWIIEDGVRPEPEAPAPVPSTPGKAALLEDIASPAPPEAEEPKPSPLREAIDAMRPAVPHLAAKKPRDQEWWNWFEETVGKRWTAWLGSVGFIVAAGLLVRLAYARGWFGPKTIIVLGVIVGLATVIAGERFIRRGMSALGQGLVGTGLAVMYVSLFAGYGFHGFPPQTVTFALLLLVTAGGVALAVARDALPISFLAVLGGLLTPVMLSTGVDARDVLFAYLLVLDIGVLAVAFFKNWRALDVLAFVGTWAYFSGWWIEYYDPSAVAPTMVWLAAFYLVFLLQPFVYYLRAGSPIAGERFFMAVSNAAGMFGWAYAILHKDHPNALGLVALAMAGSYLALGAVTRKRVRGDVRAVFGFIALSVMFVTITIPILLDFHGMTVAWALEAPVLVYLAYKYGYFPVRAGALVPLVLAGGRVLLLDWRAGTEAFVPVFNRDFGTAIFVAAAGWAYAVIQHRNRKEGIRADRFFKIATGIAAGFFALVVMHVEVWQCLDITEGLDPRRWATAFVWVAGAAGLLACGMLLRSIHARLSGFVAFLVALVLLTWDYGLGTREGRLMFLDGRFLAGLAAVLVVFIYASVCRRSKKVCSPEEKRLSVFLQGAGILLAALLVSFETWQWLALRDHLYAARIVLVFVWAAGSAGYLASGVRLRSIELRVAGLVALAASAIIAAVGYGYRFPSGGVSYFNWRFVAAAAVGIMAFVYAYVLRHKPGALKPEEKRASHAVHGVAIMALLVLVSWETSHWLTRYDREYLARCLLPVIWALGSAGYLASGIRLRSMHLRAVGLFALVVAAIFAARGYPYAISGGHILYLNGRFLAGLAVVLMIFVHASVLRRFAESRDLEDAPHVRPLYVIVTAALLLLLSVETYLHFIRAIADPERARWVAQMALSIVWGVYAAAILAVGFWRKLRPLRFAALGLFGATALKLLVIDMKKVEGGYKIASIFVVSLLLVGASYLYHRVEKWMAAAEGAGGKDKAGAAVPDEKKR